MKPLVSFGDPEVAVRSYYEASYAGALSDRKPTEISTQPPTARLTAGATHLQVELDGTPSSADYPATERATVRVNCYAAPGHRSDVKAMASLAQGLLSVHPGDAATFGTYPLVGRSSVITDPDTKNLMVWFTFRVNMRPVAVSA